MTKIVTFTAIFGGYDTLQPAKYPSLCFMDGGTKPVRGWEYRTIFSGRPPKWANRHCKLLVEDHIDAEYSIYHDGNIQLQMDPREVVGRWLKGADIAVFAHPDRKCVYDEGEACIAQHKAPAGKVHPQMARYQREGYPKNNGLAACWVVVRRHTAAVRRFNEAWWAEYGAGAQRDQLSFNYVCWKLGLKYNVIPGNLFKGTSGAFKRGPHKRNKMAIDWKTAYGQVLLIDERRWLKDTAGKIQAKFGKPTIVNIGVFRCASMYCLRAGAPKAKLIGVDIKPCDVKIDPGLKAHFIIADSARCHDRVKPPVHLLLIDGDHHYRAVRADLVGWTPKIPPGGIVACHDYAPLPKHLAKLPELEGVRRAVNEWAERAKWERILAPDSLAAFRRPG